MKVPKITIQLINTVNPTQFYYDVTIGNEKFRLGWRGGMILSDKYGHYFLDTAYNGVTQTQALYKLEPADFEFSEISK